YAAGCGHEEGEGEVGGGVGEDAWGVGDGYAPAGGLGNDDVVVAYGHVCDDFEVGGGVHDFGVNGVGEQAEQAVVVFGLQFVYEFLFGPDAVGVGVDVQDAIGAYGVAQALDSDGGGELGHQDAHGFGHGGVSSL